MTTTTIDYDYETETHHVRRILEQRSVRVHGVCTREASADAPALTRVYLDAPLTESERRILDRAIEEFRVAGA